MRERSPLGVLTREPDRDPVLEERRERKRLGVAPVDSSLTEALAATLELACELRVHVEAVGHLQELLAELEEPIGRHRRDDGGSGVGLRQRLGVRNRRCEARAELVVRASELASVSSNIRADRPGPITPSCDETRRVRLADRDLLFDPLRLERLRVRRLVLLVVAEPPVADEIHDDVVPELLAIREGEPDRRERGLGIVGVDVDDRNVEALREIARVPRRAALRRIGREADLVVRDEVQRPAGRVAVEAVQVERLGDDSLPGERGIPVDEDRERNRRIVDAGAGRTVGLLGAREPLHHRIDRLEVARIRRDGDLDLPRLGHARLRGREVVLDVAGAALRVGDEGVDRSLALELTEDRRVRPPDDVREDVESASMCDADEHLVRATTGGELDGLVEHRHEDVEALDRELLLADERTPQVGLERLHLREPLEQRAPLLGGQRPTEPARLDRLTEPDALGVIRDVLDLVGDRPRVDLTKPRERVTQRLTGHREPEELGGNAGLELRRQRRLEARLVECGVPHRLRAERIEARIQMPVHAIRLHERHRGCDRRRRALRRAAEGTGGAATGGGTAGGGGATTGSSTSTRPPSTTASAPFPSRPVRPPTRRSSPGSAVRTSTPPASKSVAPSRIDCLRILEVLLEELPDVPGVQAGGLEAGHAAFLCAGVSRSRCRSGRQRPCRGRTPLPRRRPRPTRAVRWVSVIRTAMSATTIAEVASSPGLRAIAMPDRANENAHRNPATRSARC